MNPQIVNNLLQYDRIEYYVNDVHTHNKSLNIMYLNIQSIRNKLDELKLLIADFENQHRKTIDIIALSEIWIYRHENFLYSMDNYDCYFSNRNSNRSGGCCMYIHKSIDATLNDEFEYELSSFLSIKLTNHDLNIACIYRCCDGNIENFNRIYEDKILSRKKTIVIGDININIKNNSESTMNYIESNQSNGYLCLNSLNSDHYTRKSNTVNTYIDHIFTDQLHHDYRITLTDTPISDHRMILLSVNIDTVINNNKKDSNKYTVIDYEQIDRNINKLEEIAKNTVFETFHTNLTDFIKENTKNVTKKKKCIKSWATDELIKLFRQRNKLYKLKCKYPDNERLHEEFKNIKIKARNLKNYKKKTYYKDKIENCMDDNRKMWQVMNEIIFKKQKAENTIKQIKHNEKLITDNNEKAKIFNEFFINIIQTKNDEIDLENETIEIREPFRLYPTTKEEIKDIISQLSSQSSNGYDDISSKFVKKYSEILAEPLSKHINSTFLTGIYPESLKIGVVIPIHKKGSKENCSNYRPITKLSTLDKIFEEAALKRLKYFLNCNKIINCNQFGFVDGSNTLAAALNCVEMVYDSMDIKKYIAIMSLDLEKAFDSVNPRILLNKLTHLGIDSTNKNLFESFLQGRRQISCVNRALSDPGTIKNGVPQGAKLSATLFLIYINGIMKLTLKSKIQLYADDGLMIFSADSFEELVNDMTQDVEKIQNWCDNNQLKMNRNHKNIPNDEHFIGLNYKNQLIKREKSLNYLGLTIDENMSWNEQVNKLKEKIIPISFAIYRARKIIPRKLLWMIYNSNFLSHISYLNPIWNGCAEKYISGIQRLQNKIIKTIEPS